jgi:hypothetical protein
MLASRWKIAAKSFFASPAARAAVAMLIRCLRGTGT